MPIGSKAIDASARTSSGAGRGWSGCATSRHVFVNLRGTGLSRQGLYKIVQRHAASAGLEHRMSPHTLRHTLRHPPAGGRLRPALAAGDARARRHRHDAGLHAPVGRPAARRLLRRAPAGADRPRGRRVPAVGITHFDEAPAREYAVGHIKGRWTALGEAAGSATVGGSPDRDPARGAGRPPPTSTAARRRSSTCSAVAGSSWQRERTTEIRAGDCIVYLPRRGAHSLHALEPLDVLAFGPRHTMRVPVPASRPVAGRQQGGRVAARKRRGRAAPVRPRSGARRAGAPGAGGAAEDDRQRRRTSRGSRSGGRGSHRPGATSARLRGRRRPVSSTWRSPRARTRRRFTATRRRRRSSSCSTATARCVLERRRRRPSARGTSSPARREPGSRTVPRRCVGPDVPRLRHPRARRHVLLPALEQDLIPRSRRDRPAPTLDYWDGED